MVRACHTPRQPLRNHPSGHFRGWATPGSAGDMLDGRQTVDIPAHARTTRHAPSLEKTGRGFLLNRPSCPPATQSLKRLNRTELKCSSSSASLELMYLLLLDVVDAVVVR